MELIKKVYQIFLSFLALKCAWTLISEPFRVSLRGKKVDLLQQGCHYWLLNPQPSLPALDKFSICVDLQQTISSSTWTAFMYRHPDGSRVEMGLDAVNGNLRVLLFGRTWSSSAQLLFGEWNSICITWSMSQPKLYINGKIFAIEAHPLNQALSPSCCRLASGGSLTLGVAQSLTKGRMVTESGTEFKGSVSMFRMWSCEKTPEQLLQVCTDGDVLNWDATRWSSVGLCTPVPDIQLQCAWSKYEVKMRFLIHRYDGNTTNVYDAREIAHKWLREILRSNIYLHKVSVYKSLAKLYSEVMGQEDLRDNPTVNLFDCLVHLNIIPPEDVGTIQLELTKLLNGQYITSTLLLVTYHSSILIHPIEAFPSEPTVTIPTDVITETSVPTITPSIVAEQSPATQTSSVATVGTISDSFFKISLNVTIGGSNTPPNCAIKAWLHTTLSMENIVVLNFQLTLSSEVPRMDQPYRPFHSCIFQAQVTTSSNVEETKTKIRMLLENHYVNGTMTLFAKPEDILISHIQPGSCPEHHQQTRHGLFLWPETETQRIVSQPCEANPSNMASRKCLLGAVTNKARWVAPDLHLCNIVLTAISDLDHIEVTNENAADIVNMIKDFMMENKHLSDEDLLTILNKLAEVVNFSRVTPPIGEAIINITSDILKSDSNLLPFTNNILSLIEMVGDKMTCFSGDLFHLVAPALAISVVNVDPQNFHTMTFGVSSASERPEIHINKYPLDGTVAFISLPSTLQNSFPENSMGQPRIQFQFYGVPTLFEDVQMKNTLNTYVVAASVTNASEAITDLKEPIVVTLQHLKAKKAGEDVRCVYWDFNKYERHRGGWSTHGCLIHDTSSHYTTCLCNHLTHFGVLLDVSRIPVDEKNEEILTLISYLGCGVSSFFLGVTVLTYIIFEKLRRDYPSKILLNLSLALLGLNLVFLGNSWLSSFGSDCLCVIVASLLHYFLLASFTWMGLEAVNMYFALVKVFNVYVPSYILKFCFAGWGIPLVICCLVLVIKKEAYGSATSDVLSSHENSTIFCWVQDDVVFYVSVVGYIALVLLCNGTLFIIVLVQIQGMRGNQPAGTRSGLLKDLRGVVSLTCLLGLTWSLALFTWSPAKVPLLYLFSILNSLQGFFLFVFHCLMKENVRKQWRVHLCFGRFKLQEYSEWSHTATVMTKPKQRQRPKFPSVASTRSNKSSSTETSTASSDSSQRQVFHKRPNLGLVYQSDLAILRDQRSPSPFLQDRGPFLGEREHEIPSCQPKDVSYYENDFK